MPGVEGCVTVDNVSREIRFTEVAQAQGEALRVSGLAETLLHRRKTAHSCEKGREKTMKQIRALALMLNTTAADHSHFFFMHTTLFAPLFKKAISSFCLLM